MVCEAKPLRREFLLKMGRTGFSKSDMDEALARLERGIQRMESWLEGSGGPWLMGGRMTFADIAIMPIIVRLDDIGLGTLWDGAPTVSRWFDAIRKSAPFGRTYYHGAFLTEKYPGLADRISAGTAGGS